MSEKILIIGGGFAGLRLARTLNQKREKRITVIDKVNHHMFQPLFYQVASGRIEPSNISFPFRKIFQKSKNIQFRMTDIVKIIPEENKVVSEDAEFKYDKLVIATGCKTNFYGNEVLEGNQQYTDILQQYWNDNADLQKLHEEFSENTISNF